MQPQPDQQAPRVEGANRERRPGDLCVDLAGFEDFYSHAPCGFHSLDAEGNFLHINATEAGWLGYAPEELIGRPMTMILSPQSREVFHRCFPQFVDQGRIEELELEYVEKGGDTRPVVLSATALKDDAGRYVMSRAVVLDLSEHRCLEKELKRSLQLLTHHIENSPLALVEWDADFRLSHWSGRAEEMFGWKASEVWGKGFREFRFVHEEDLPGVAAVIRRLLDGLEERNIYQNRNYSRDGSLLYCEWYTSVVRDESGRIMSYMSLVQDITQRKRAEAERDEVLRREQEARAEIKAARELDQLKATFVDSVTHDLRTPLTSIVGYCELLEDQVEARGFTAQREYVAQIARNAQRLGHMIEDLLDFARMEAGTFELEREEFDFAHRVRDIAASLAPLVEDARVTLELELPEAPLAICADAQRIDRVLANLMHNAVKFTPPGGHVRVRARCEGAHVRCEVEDTGVGIPAEQQAQLFQRFVQLDAGRNKRQGTGLGLSICKAFVDAHQGRLGVSSETGKGSTFWIELPCCGPATYPQA